MAVQKISIQTIPSKISRNNIAFGDIIEWDGGPNSSASINSNWTEDVIDITPVKKESSLKILLNSFKTPKAKILPAYNRVNTFNKGFVDNSVILDELIEPAKLEKTSIIKQIKYLLSK